MRRNSLWMAGLFTSALLWASHAVSQAATPPMQEIDAAITSIVDQIATDKYAEAAGAITKRMENDEALGTVRQTFETLRSFGAFEYYDRIIDRAYGMTGKDVIYKFVYEKNIMFFRFTVHLMHERWRITSFALQSEFMAPLPRVWTNVIP